MSKEFLEFLLKEWKRLEEVEHVSDLFNNDRYNEVDAIIAEIDYSDFYEYMRTGERLTVSEIPAEYILTSAIYFSGNKAYSDDDIMEAYQEYANAIYGYGKKGEYIGVALASGEIINGYDSIKELVEAGKEYLKDDEKSAE